MQLLLAFWDFYKKTPKFTSWAKPEADEQFDTSAVASECNKNDETLQQKKFRIVNDIESLAKAVPSYAPSQEVQEQ